MAEYIERASLVGALINSNAQAMIRAMTGEEAYSYFLRLVNTAPAADVAPVRHGRWIKNSFLSDDITTAEKCCQCGEIISWFSKAPNCCPNCGAKTDGGNDDDRGSHGERCNGEAVLGV